MISTLYTMLETCGFHPLYIPPNGQSLAVKIGNQEIHFSIQDCTKKDSKNFNAAPSKTSASPGMRFIIYDYYSSQDIKTVWEDTTQRKLENVVHLMAAELIFAGEAQTRIGQMKRHESRIKGIAELERRHRELKLEEERKAEERRIRQAQEEVDALLRQSSAFRQANEIREYVKAVQLANIIYVDSEVEHQLTVWVEWALTQTNFMDPVKSGAYRALFERET